MASDVLDPNRHARLIQDPHYCDLAGIPREALSVGASEHCGPTELSWLQNMKKAAQGGMLGLAYVAQDRVHLRMQALTAVMLRNFMDARLRSAETIVEDREGELRRPTVILIPDFQGGAERNAHARSRLSDLLVARAARGLLTVVGVQSVAATGKQYGAVIESLLHESYVLLEGEE